jgi:CO dehydrogenase/acetyl-CoA synthase gamma subunit (corrinoid Fe-S protein)
MEIINAVENIWNQSNYRKPTIFYGVYNNNYYVTVSDQSPIYYFVNMIQNKPHVYAVVSHKCIIKNINGIKYYDIFDTEDDVKLNKIALVPVSCTAEKFTDIQKFTVKNVLPLIIPY